MDPYLRHSGACTVCPRILGHTIDSTIPATDLFSDSSSSRIADFSSFMTVILKYSCYTICPGSLDPLYIVTYFTAIVKTSWMYSRNTLINQKMLWYLLVRQGDRFFVQYVINKSDLLKKKYFLFNALIVLHFRGFFVVKFIQSTTHSFESYYRCFIIHDKFWI